MSELSKTAQSHQFRVHGAEVDASFLRKINTALGHGKFLDINYLSHGDDWVELTLKWRDDLVGAPETGVLASGPIISLLDTATSMAVWIRRGTFAAHATLDLRIDYVRAATPGKTLIGRGECYKLKRRVGFARGIAHEGDPSDPVAHATALFMTTDG